VWPQTAPRVTTGETMRAHDCLATRKQQQTNVAWRSLFVLFVPPVAGVPLSLYTKTKQGIAGRHAAVLS